MITEKELLEAISECQREPITCAKVGKLADLFTVHHYLFGEKEPRAESAAEPAEIAISARGNSEFMSKIDGMNYEKFMGVMDELMETIEVINPRLYAGVIQKLSE